MATYHGIVNTAHCSCWDVDALNLAAINATTDTDNGALVTLGEMRLNDNGGFEYNVELAAKDATNVWLVATPEVGYSLDMQIHDDIRYFYNEAGKPMSIKGLIPGVDCIEVDAMAFTDGSLPTAVGQYCGVEAQGKFATANASAPATGAYFRIEGFHTITCGPDEVQTVILRCMKNG